MMLFTGFTRFLLPVFPVCISFLLSPVQRKHKGVYAFVSFLEQVMYNSVEILSYDVMLKHYVIAKQIWGSNCQFFFTDRKTLSSLPKSLTCVMLLSIWIFVIVGNSMESIAKLWRQFPWVGRDWSLVVGCPRDWPRVVGTGGLSL